MRAFARVRPRKGSHGAFEMYRKVVLILIVVLSVSILVVGIAVDKEHAELYRRGAEVNVVPPSQDEERLYGKGVALTRFDRANKYKLYSITGNNFFPHRDGPYEIVRPSLTLFSGEEDNRELVTVSAEHGFFEPRRESLGGGSRLETIPAKGSLSGNVVMQTPDGIRATFQTAEWREDTRMITSEGPIRIETPNFIVYGTGLESVASAEADEIIIRKNIRVVFDEVADAAFADAFALEDSTIRNADVGMVITCDGTLSYKKSEKSITFEENVLLVPVTGSFSRSPVAQARQLWLDRVNAGESVLLNLDMSPDPALFARKSVAITLSTQQALPAAKDGAWTIEKITALENVWFLRGEDTVHADRLDFSGKSADIAGAPAQLWHGPLELEGGRFGISGLSREGAPSIVATEPGVLRTDMATWGGIGPAADEQDAQRRATISWDKGFAWNEKERNALFEGKVVAEDASGRLLADELNLDLGSDGVSDAMTLKSMRAVKDVRYEEADTIILADEMFYDRGTGVINLTRGPGGRASLKKGSDVIESEELTVVKADGDYRLNGKGLGRMLYFQDPEKQKEPSYDIRWRESCAYGDNMADFRGEVKAVQDKSELKCGALSMEFAEPKEGSTVHTPRRIVAQDNVMFDDLSPERRLHARGDKMTYDYDTRIMRLESTTPFDQDLRNPPPEAMALVDLGGHRLRSRVINYREDEDSGARLLWTRRGGEVAGSRIVDPGTPQEMIERIALRCDKTVLYGDAGSIGDLLDRVELALGKEPLPDRLLPIEDSEEAETSIAIFVGDAHKVRLLWQTGEDPEHMKDKLWLKCRYLETHFVSAADTGRSGKLDIARIRALGDVEMDWEMNGQPVRVTGHEVIWVRDPVKEWTAEITGDPYATFARGREVPAVYEKIILEGFPADVSMERIMFIEGSAP